MRDSSPRPVEYYSTDVYEYVTSEREYITLHSIQAVEEDHSYGYERPMPTMVTLYLDPLNGLVVWDVPAYEKSFEDTDA